MRTRLRRFILDIMHEPIAFLGKIHFPYSVRLVTGKNYREAEAKLRTGDVILTRRQGQVSNWMIPGFYTHAAMYVGNFEVIEAIGKGVVLTDLVQFLMKKDYFVILRPTFASEYQCCLAAEVLEGYLGLPYDYGFEPGNNSFYCAELCWHGYDKVIGENIPFKRRETLGVKTVTAQDFYEARTKFDCVYETEKVKI